MNPQLAIVDATNARGSWGLHYQQINTRDRTLTQLGAYYEDEYRKLGGEWKIAATRCVVTSTLVMDLAEAAAVIQFAGRPAPTVPGDAALPA
ncbi:nuclear transport factor 2 family protein [Neisseriaceae bacterium JH1-16]|nr:nuclear transport factor 2 family protein [Neisseriaceae bacterium JH1-16]